MFSDFSVSKLTRDLATTTLGVSLIAVSLPAIAAPQVIEGDKSTGGPATASAQTSTTTTVTGTATAAGKSTSKADDKAAAKPKAKKEDTVIVIDKGKTFVSSTDKKWQKAIYYVQLQPGQDSMPLNMEFTNNDMSGVRVSLCGGSFLTEKDFAGHKTVSKSITGIVSGSGANQMICYLFGAPNSASFSWRVISPKFQLKTLTPAKGTSGDRVTVDGVGLPVGASLTIMVANKGGSAKVAQVLEGTAKKAVFIVPAGLKSGDAVVYALVGGVKSNELKFGIRVAPEITGVDMLSVPPEQPFSITGKNFSEVASENEVTVDGVPARVTSASPTRLALVMPVMEYPKWQVPIKVKTNGVEGTGDVKINVTMRVVPNDGDGPMP